MGIVLRFVFPDAVLYVACMPQEVLYLYVYDMV
jgi:hypothetical protein